MSVQGKRILILSPYPLGTAPSQRFRYEQYLELLKSSGYKVVLSPFLDRKSWESLYQSGGSIFKAWSLIRAWFKRWVVMTRIGQYDQIFIHREIALIGPPIFEWFIAKLWGKKYIYDFDDAMWLPNVSEVNRAFVLLKWHWKFKKVVQMAGKISAGNTYLAEKARRYSKADIQIIPTTIDTVHHHNRVRDRFNKPITFGWTGTHTTMPYLKQLLPAFKKLRENHSFRLLVISNEKPNWDMDELEFIKWTAKSEIEDLLRMDVGLMPLLDSEWAKGKCGFKALQYMALGIPAMVSAVGVNTKIVEHEINGLIMQDQQDWIREMKAVLEDQYDLQKLGIAARDKVVRQYSVQSNQSNFLSLFQ